MTSMEERAQRWLEGHDKGSSSIALCDHMLARQVRSPAGSPSDPADLGRCLRLLALIPEWQPRIDEMAALGPGWAGLVPHWAELSSLMADEVGIAFEKGRDAQRTYRAMKAAIAAGYRADPRYDCSFAADGSLVSWRRKDGRDSGFAIDGATLRARTKAKSQEAGAAK